MYVLSFGEEVEQEDVSKTLSDRSDGSDGSDVSGRAESML